MLREHLDLADDLDARDVRGCVATRRVADAVGAPMSVAYCKSAPYFLNFLDGYQLGDKVRKALDGQPDPEVTAPLGTAQLLDADTIDQREPVDCCSPPGTSPHRSGRTAQLRGRTPAGRPWGGTSTPRPPRREQPFGGDERPSALLAPPAALAALCDPLPLAQQRPDETAPLAVFQREVRQQLRAYTTDGPEADTTRSAEP